VTYRLDRPLSLTAAPGDPAARVVEDGDSDARFVLGGAGSEIPLADARRYGLVQEAPDGEAVEAEEEAPEAGPQDEGAGAAEGDAVPEGGEGKALTAPPAHKAVAAPPATKRRGPGGR
jgi:hypothetical protein